MRKYKLGEIAKEVQRQNMITGAFPEDHKKGQPSDVFIAKRIKRIYGRYPGMFGNSVRGYFLRVGLSKS